MSEHTESATEENDTLLKGSQTAAEVEQEDKEGKEEVNEGNADAKEKDVEDELPKVSTTRRSSKKQTASVEGGAKTEEMPRSDDEWKEDKSFWEAGEGTAEVSDVRHKEREGKSSLWQVKSSNDSGGAGGGEIKKIKLCIVRPSEALEPSPRKRKRLSRNVGSHRDKPDTQECEEVDDDHGEENKNMSGSSGEGQNLEEFTEIIKDEGEVSLKEDAEQKGVSEERSPQSRILSEEGQQEMLQNEDQVETADEIGQESAEDKQNVQKSEVNEDAPAQKSSDLKDSISSETSEKLCVVQESCDRTVQDDVSVEESSGGQAESEEQVVEQKDSNEGKDLNAVSCEEEPKEKLELCTAGETKPEEELQSVEHLSQERVNNSEATVQVSAPCDVEDKNTTYAEEDANTACASTDGERTSTEELKEGTATEERHKVKDVSEDRPEEMQETAEEAGSCEEELVAHNSSQKTKLANSHEDGHIHDSSEETSTYHEESKSNVEANDAEVKESTKGPSRDKSDKKTSTKRVFLEERSHTRDSSEEKPVHEIKRRRQSRESNSSRSFSRSPGKQVHRRGDRDSSRRNRVQDSERSDKHNKKRDISRNSSSDRQASWHSRRRSRSPQRQREKISLRRSFSKRNNSHGGEKADVKDEVKNMGSSTDDARPCIKEDKENVWTISEQSGTPLEPSQNVTRRRRWGAGKTSRAGKKPVLSISTDSLKSLIPGAKPVPVSEVQLSQEEEDRRERESEHEKDDIDKREKPRNKDKVTDNQDMLDKRSVGPMTVSETHKISIALTDVHRGKTASRKISIVSDDARTLQNSPSPPRHKVSDVLFISNLVRPFTVNQLKELLARTGSIVEAGFWIDKIKSKCYVQYKTEAEARETRHALHGVRWPVSNPKQLCVDFGKKEDMDLAQALTEEDQVPRKTEPLKVERSVEGWVAEQVREKERERELRERERERDKEKSRMKERPHHAVPAVETLERNRNIKMSASVREWDLGKIGQLSPTEKEPKHEDKNKERERRVRKEKIHHSRSASPHDAPARKQKKKEEEAPAKLLDDLFRKTKSTPCIYWLPLTAEQIVVKEEMRRRHMAEHERRMAEVRKAERERERARAQQRQQRRTGERDKRRRRTASGSPKK